MIKMVTVVTIASTLLTGVAVAIVYLLTAYAPLWIQVASIPVVGWLMAMAIVTLVDSGAFDRWTEE